MIKSILLIAALAGSLAVAAPKMSDTKPGATAMLKDASGKSVGRVDFFSAGDGVLLRAKLNGVPAGEHAFHIHETGKCDAPDFKSAGGHFNPMGASHGYLSGKKHHAGDMPNFDAPANGDDVIEVFNDGVTLDGKGKSSLFKSGGTAVVIHSGADDYASQPSGDAGSRIACGVIESAR